MRETRDNRFALLALGLVSLALAVSPAFAKVATRTLDNGMTLVVQENADAAVFAIDIVVRSDGSEDGERSGLRTVVAATTMTGIEGRSEDEVREFVGRLEDLGGSIGGRATDEFVELHATGPNDQFAASIEFVGAALGAGAYAEKPVDTYVKAAQIVANGLQEDPNIERLIRQVLFPVPQSGNEHGTVETLRDITRDDVVALAQQLYRPDRLVCAIVANAPADELLELAEEAFGSLEPAPGTRIPELPDWAALAREREEDPQDDLLPLPYRSIVAEDVGMRASQVMLGFAVPAVGEPDWPLAAVCAALLDPSAGGRLERETVFEPGLEIPFGQAPIGAMCSAARSIANNHLVVFAYTRGAPLPGSPRSSWNAAVADQTVRMEEAVRRAVASLSDDPPTEAEVARAKRRVLGGNRLRLMTAGERAQFYALTSLAGLGTDGQQAFETAVRDATPEQIQGFAQEYLAKDDVGLAIILPAEDPEVPHTMFPDLRPQG